MKKFKEKLKYSFDQFLSKGSVALVISLFLVMLIIVVIIGGLLYFINPDSGLGFLIWTSFMQTLDPGNLSGETGTLFYMIMMTLATIVGIFITSLFISFILNGFQTRLENLSRGRSKVMESNHTLILGWDDNIFVVLRELIEANLSKRKPVVVVLSERDSVEMNQEIKDNINIPHNTKIICRNGSIYKNADLDMCNIQEARSIIILEDDLNTIKSLLVIANSSFYEKAEGHVCALMYDEKNIEVAKNIGKDKLEVVYLKSAITRIMTQTCLQAGLSYVYNNLLSFEGDEIYFHPGTDFVGKQFSDVILMFKNAAVIGIVRDGQTRIRPQMDTTINENDMIILISEDDDKADYGLEIPQIDMTKIANKEHVTSRKKEFISIVGFNRKTIDILNELHNYLEKGSKIKILVNSMEASQELSSVTESLSDLEISVIIGETYSRSVLEEFIVPDCHYVMIFANENISFSDQDSQTLLTLLHLRDIEEKRDSFLDIITEISDVKNSEIVDLAKVDDFIISELIANKMLTQISENRHLVGIYEDLLSSEGSEIYLKPAENYVVLNEEVDFYTVSVAASNKNEIAIGYKLKPENHLPEVIVNPVKGDKILFQSGDMVIVVSED
jgi:Trk K+ transport system NAD-binding subunit